MKASGGKRKREASEDGETWGWGGGDAKRKSISYSEPGRFSPWGSASAPQDL